MTGIVILDYNNAQDTINCIESVVKYTPVGTFKLFVIENGSDDLTCKAVSDYVESNFSSSSAIISDNDEIDEFPLVTLLLSKNNEGYARGNNKALEYFDKDKDIDYILILNNDIIFIEDIISPLVKYANKLPDCGVVSATLLKRDMENIDVNCARKDYTKVQFFLQYLFLFKDVLGILGKYEHQQRLFSAHPELLKKEYQEIEIPSGSCMLLKKDVFRQIGFFDRNTFLYFEENILYRKLQDIGLKNYIVPGIKCIHLGAATLGKKQTSSYFANKCHIQSNVYYLQTYCNSPLLAFYVKVMSRLVLFKIKIQSKFRK